MIFTNLFNIKGVKVFDFQLIVIILLYSFIIKQFNH